MLSFDMDWVDWLVVVVVEVVVDDADMGGVACSGAVCRAWAWAVAPIDATSRDATATAIRVFMMWLLVEWEGRDSTVAFRAPRLVGVAHVFRLTLRVALRVMLRISLWIALRVALGIVLRNVVLGAHVKLHAGR